MDTSMAAPVSPLLGPDPLVKSCDIALSQLSMD